MNFSIIQLLALTGSIFFLAIILWSVRQRKLKEAYALLWLFTGGIMLFVSVWPRSLHLISEWIGIVYPPAALFLILLCGIILILFQYALLLSRNQERISRLAQEIAILKKELETLKKQHRE